MKKKLLVTLLVGVSLLLCGCALPGQRSHSAKGAVEAPPAVNFAKSDSITADVYIDGTTSMYGYVNYPGGTIYADAMKAIDGTITSTWKSDEIKYVKFGDSFQQLSRDAFLQMDKTNFYDQKDTSLQKVVEQANDKDLTIIVTDLFQTNQDLDSLVHSIKNKGLGEGKALAVIGFKSQFNGKIFDVGKNLSSVDYASTDDTASYRPVYVLVLGNENDARAFTANYLKKLPKEAQAQAAFLSANLGTDVSLEADKVSNKKKDGKKKAAKLAEISNLLPNNDIMQYRLKKDEKASEAAARLYAKNVIGKIPDTYQITTDSVENWSNNSFTKVDADNFITGDVADAGLKDGTANLALDVQTSAEAIHKKEGIYRAQLSLIPDKDNYIQAMNVFSDWNFDDSQINDNPETIKQVGSKTLNISKFLSQLASLNYELNKPGFHNVYIYFEVK